MEYIPSDIFFEVIIISLLQILINGNYNYLYLVCLAYKVARHVLGMLMQLKHVHLRQQYVIKYYHHVYEHVRILQISRSIIQQYSYVQQLLQCVAVFDLPKKKFFLNYNSRKKWKLSNIK